MNRTTVKKYLRYIDLHDERAVTWAIYACLILLAILALYTRISLVRFKSGDYLAFSSWYDFIKAHGLHAFKYNFSNYNPPYTYFLYLATLLPISKIAAIKGILVLFDIVMAVSVYLVVKSFRPQSYVPAVAALVSLFVPTVLFTGVFASQFDQLYTAFMFFSLYFGLKDRSRLAWTFIGIAIAIKLQAFFLLPVLGVMCFRRIKWYDIIWGVGAFLAVSLLPVIAGRSVMSILSIYPDQTGSFNHYLTANAPNMYQWFPNSVFSYFDHMGLGLALAASLLLILASLVRRRFSNKDLLLATVLMFYALPFLLPAMHERYFFPAGVASLVLAFAYPTTTYAGLAVLAQVVTIFTYCPFLFATAPIPFSILSIFTLVIICIMTARFLEMPKHIDEVRSQRPAKVTN